MKFFTYGRNIIFFPFLPFSLYTNVPFKSNTKSFGCGFSKLTESLFAIFKYNDEAKCVIICLCLTLELVGSGRIGGGETSYRRKELICVSTLICGVLKRR